MWNIIDVIAAVGLIVLWWKIKNNRVNMRTVKQSFLSNLLDELGEGVFDFLYSDVAKLAAKIYTVVLLVLLFLSTFYHWGFISSLLNLMLGTSIPFVVYIIFVISVLDIKVDVEVADRWEKDPPRPKSYNRTKIWGTILIFLAICAIWGTNRYRHYYSFQCDTFLVDKAKGIYHIPFFEDDCETINEAEDYPSLTTMKGYEIEKLGYNLCSDCEAYADNAEDTYNSERFTRR